MAKYLKLVLPFQASFGSVKVSQISRGKNSHANSLATLASSVVDCIPQIISVELLKRLCIDHLCSIAATSTASLSWLDHLSLMEHS